MKPVAFVCPWYGEGIPGGAESACRDIVNHLKKAGVPVEVITTTIYSFQSDWSTNAFEEKVYTVGGVPVRRFSVGARDREAFDRVNLKFIQKQSVSREEERIFFSEMFHSPALFSYLRKHVQDYCCFVFIPYMFPTSYSGVEQVREKAVLIPCFHDEPYAHTETIKDMVSKVKGIIYLSGPERDFAENTYTISPDTRQVTIGTIVPVKESKQADADRFRKKYAIHDPFILYAGRKDPGKNADVMTRYFLEYKKANAGKLKLVLIGDRNRFSLPEGTRDVVDLGFVDLEDKYDAMQGALFLCQPSVMESFSIVIMESWMGERPVLVHANCDVTRDFVTRSSGGLYFKDYYEFCSCVDFFLTHPQESNYMGKRGKQFVLSNFTQEVVVEKYKNFFETLGESS